jgi:hypothetical protein
MGLFTLISWTLTALPQQRQRNGSELGILVRSSLSVVVSLGVTASQPVKFM